MAGSKGGQASFTFIVEIFFLVYEKSQGRSKSWNFQAEQAMTYYISIRKHIITVLFSPQTTDKRPETSHHDNLSGSLARTSPLWGSSCCYRSSWLWIRQRHWLCSGRTTIKFQMPIYLSRRREWPTAKLAGFLFLSLRRDGLTGL